MFRSLIVAACALFLSASVAWAEEKAELGKPAPQFSLKDSSGNQVSLSDYSGKVVVLEWINPQCPFVVRHYEAGTMKNLAQKHDGKVVWLAINSTSSATPAENAAWASKHSLPYPILSDPDGTVGKAYEAKTTPHMYIIDPQGKLVYRGGIDDDPQGNKSERTHYVQQALEQVTAGEKVAQAETRPYGCSVKYK